MKEIFPYVFADDKRLFTLNLTPGKSEYAKSVKKSLGKEYREWDPYHSKMAAAIARGLKTFPAKAGSKILYLGISNGTTASF